MFKTVTNLIRPTPRALFSHILLRYRTKYEVDRMNRCRDMAIRNFRRWRPAAILDLVQPQVAPFDPPTSKTLP